jgi:uncharacterized membrane protein
MKTHPHVPRVHVSHDWGDRVADRVAGWFGSMGCLYVLVAWMLVWMCLASFGVWAFRRDPYPFAALLFLSNLVQLWALPILGTATNRADQKRSAKAEADHVALSYIATTVDEIDARLDALRSLSAALSAEKDR